jgi:hypothetical protein
VPGEDSHRVAVPPGPLTGDLPFEPQPPLPTLSPGFNGTARALLKCSLASTLPRYRSTETSEDVSLPRWTSAQAVNVAPPVLVAVLEVAGGSPATWNYEIPSGTKTGGTSVVENVKGFKLNIYSMSVF